MKVDVVLRSDGMANSACKVYGPSHFVELGGKEKEEKKKGRMGTLSDSYDCDCAEESVIII